MMDIFTTKESALIHLNSTRIEAGEIRVYRYYSSIGSTDSFVVIGLQDGIGPDCYQILSKRKNLIVCIDTELPDSSRLIQGQIHVCPVNGIYHMVYIEDSQRIDREISDSEVFYVEDFDSGFMYYLDRYTCKKLDDYFSKVYIDLSNTSALYEAGKYPETTVTVWKDNSDITSACQIGISTVGCNAIYDGSKTIRVTSMTDKTAKVILRVVYRGNTYQETWNIQKVQEGLKGADAEAWTVLSKTSFIREPDMQSTILQVLYQSGTETSHLEVPSLQNYGLYLTYEYSNGQTGQIDTQEFEFEPRVLDDDTELTFCIIRLLNQDSEVLSAITLPYLPNTSTLSSGQGVYKAIVFCRSNDIPETPLGGNWDSPVPTTGQWFQETPEGTEVLWASTRIFTTDSKTPQESAWSIPSRISNSENLEVMYSTCQDSEIVGTPSTNSENWESVVTGIAYFMATRTIINGVPGLWQVFAIHGVDGDAGDYKNYIYYNSDTKPETPAGSHPSGWADFPNADGTWWMCVGLFSGRTNEIIGTWSNPIRVTGLDGLDGQDAPYLVYQYAVGTSSTDAPTYNWSSSIPSVPKGMFLWQRSGTIIPPAIAPTFWNAPIRITGERGEQGAPGTAVTIDLTNEVSSVAADYEGNVIAAATFESTRVLLYYNGNPVDLETDRNVRSITIDADGVRASVGRSGLVMIYDWTAPKEQDTATVVVNVDYNYTIYTAVYSIHKVKSGSPGRDAVLYSIVPNTNVLRKVNSLISPDTLTVQVRKAVGPNLSNVTRLASEGLELVYSINGSSTEETYDFTNGINTSGVGYVTLTLRSLSTGSVIDKETVITIESSLDLLVDLTNEVSTVAALEDGSLGEYTNFENSEVNIYYGSTPVDPRDCQIKVSWSNMTGTFDQTTGIIAPSGWESSKISESTGQCTLEVTYREFTKAVTYTVTKINSGETPVLWRIVPSVSSIKATSTSVSSDFITVKVYKIRGTEITEVSPVNFSSEGVKLKYARTLIDTGLEGETSYETRIPVSLNMNKVEITLYDKLAEEIIYDRESVYVVRDGVPGAKSDWKDYIFCKKSTQPDPPTFTKHPSSGSADNHGQVWYEGPTSGGSSDDIWWMSVATIDGESADNSLRAGTSWSSPVRVTGYDGTGYECQYANSPNLVTPPESANWTDTPTAPGEKQYTWMRMRSSKDPAWKYMRITGERGSDGNSIIVKGDLSYVGNDTNKIQTSTEYEVILIGSTVYENQEMYTGNIYQGGQKILAQRVANGDTYLYSGKFFVCTGMSGDLNTWQVVSIQGDPGDSWMTYVAFASDDQGADKAQTWSSGMNYMGIAVVLIADYPNWNSVSSEQYTWAEFHGQEGIGNEFIYARNDSDTTPPVLSETGKVNDKYKEDDEFIPLGWTDDPQVVEDAEGCRVQWVSTRQKTGGTWGSFSTPVVWNRWAKDGTSISVKSTTLDYVGSNDSEYTNYILCNGYEHGISTFISGDLYLGNTKRTDVENGDTYVYKGYFFICSGTSNGKYDWVISQAKGDKGDNSYVHVRYTTESDHTSTSENISDTWGGKEYRYIGFATTNSVIAPTRVCDYKWSSFLGQDGPGQEFIYCLSDSLTTKMSGVTLIDVNAGASHSSNNKKFQDDEFLPGSEYSGDNPWTDDPKTVTRETGKQKQWVSTRTKSNGVWGKFSMPSLWSEIGGSSYSMSLGNQDLKATYGGIGVWRSSLITPDSDCESDIKNGDCAGTSVKYIKDSAQTATDFTISCDSGVSKIYIFIPGQQSATVISKENNTSISTTLESISYFELFAECTQKNVNQWSVTLSSPDGVAMVMNVTRSSFNPEISLGISCYGYTRDSNNTVKYEPSRSSAIDITYLSNRYVVSGGITVFNNYGYRVYAHYVSNDTEATTELVEITAEPTFTLTLDSIIGESASPSDGSLIFEVRKGSSSGEVVCKNSISIISQSSVNIDEVKTYLLDGNAAITGHLWAKDGKIGNWIINSVNTSVENIDYGNGTVIASYNSAYPIGSLRSANGTIVFDPSESNDGGILLKYPSNNNNPDFIKCNGTGRLAHGNLTWDANGSVIMNGSITATSGSIGGWSIGSDLDGGSLRSLDGTIVFDPSSSSPSIKIKGDADYGTNTIVLDKTGLSTNWTAAHDSGTSNHIDVNGSGYLANGNISWNGSSVGITGSIISTEGSIGGWTIGKYSISSSYSSESTSYNTTTTHTKSVSLGSPTDNQPPGIKMSSMWEASSGGRSHSGGTILSLDPEYGFSITTGSDWRETVASIDLKGNGVLGNGLINWNNDGDITITNNGGVFTFYSNEEDAETGTVSIKYDGIRVGSYDGSKYINILNNNDNASPEINISNHVILDGNGLDFDYQGEDNGEYCKINKYEIYLGYKGTNSSVKMGTMENGLCARIRIDDENNDWAEADTTGYTTGSDIRLKSNIETLPDRGALRPVSFDIGGRHGIGFIAQEVQEIYPEVISEDRSENHYLGINYPALVAAMQAQINTLRERLEKLENQ